MRKMPVSMTSQRVTRVCLDYAITLFTEEGIELKLEQPFAFSEPGVEPVVIDPARPGAAALHALGLLHGVITDFEVAESGSLTLAIENGNGIRIDPDTHYDAWTIAGRHGEKIVCYPGGELAIWDALNQQ